MQWRKLFYQPKAGVVHGSNAFFEDAARALFRVMLARLAGYGAINTSDMAKAIFEMPDDEMDRLIEKSVASSAVGGDSKGQRQGVISSIAIYLGGIQAVQPGCWSVRDFLEADDDARFFILGTDDTKAMFTPLYRLLLTASFAMIAAKQEIVHEDKYWFFLDAVLTLGDIKLDEGVPLLVQTLGQEWPFSPWPITNSRAHNTVERKQGFIDQLAHLNKDQRLTAGTNAR